VRLIYFVHNLNDPAVAKRVAMLNAAGIDVCAAGFWRGTPPQARTQGWNGLALGESFDAKLVHRACLSLKHAVASARLVRALGKADLVMARNLEMLVIAAAVGARLGVPIIYEVLDIHRLLVRDNFPGRLLRHVERTLMRRVSLLLISSPAFLTAYFEPLQFRALRLKTALFENKVLELGGARRAEKIAVPPGPPWRIGWLGMLRCEKSLAMLARLAASRPDLVRVEIYGQPSREVGEMLQNGLPASVRFGGAYQPSDLARLYGSVHFNWAIDYFEEGLNSRWLLPNRIYEGGHHNVVPLALQGTETASWLSALGLGVIFNDPAKELESFLENLSPGSYCRFKCASLSVSRTAFVARQSECDRLGRLLRQACGWKERELPPVGGTMVLP
jgi:succinoglycan biosynthesis protein ExoL